MYLALDIGGTFVKYAWMEKDGTMLNQGQIATITDDLEAFYASLLPIAAQHTLQGIAISSPGVIDSQSGLIRVVTLIPCLNGVNIKKDLEARLGVPVSVENDAKCAALAELWKGAVQSYPTSLIAVLGSGIGGAVIIDGKLYKGLRSKAGEIGTILCDFDPGTQKAVTFGRKNSAVWLVRDMAKALGLDHEDGREIFEYVKQQDPRVYPLFEEYCWNLAMVLFNIDYVLDLDCIALGGGISAQDILIEKVQECFMQLRSQYKEDDHDPVIVRCAFKNEANLLGAVYHFLQSTKMA